MNPLIQLKYENTTETAPPSKAEQRAKRDTFHFCTDHTFYDMANTPNRSLTDGCIIKTQDTNNIKILSGSFLFDYSL